jgi:hypothetical protein
MHLPVILPCFLNKVVSTSSKDKHSSHSFTLSGLESYRYDEYDMNHEILVYSTDCPVPVATRYSGVVRVASRRPFKIILYEQKRMPDGRRREFFLFSE